MSINQNTFGVAWKELEGQVINAEFHLRQFLGGSEHSAVFLTERGERGDQKAAIKLFPASTAGAGPRPESAELQLSRWKLAAELSHRNLIQLFQMGRCQLGDAELLYLVMEYAEENLSQVLPHRPLTPAEAREMLAPTLDALAYIHERGFVHGRIRPANIMAIGDQLKLSSDGLHRMGESSVGSGKPGRYDPPEAASGISSPAGDIWSLGMTLVEALTQRLPVVEAPALEEKEGGDPVVPETVPAPFLDLARRCLRRDPQRRWTAAYIAARLQPASPAAAKPPEQAPQEQAPQKQAPQKLATLKSRAAAFASSRYILPAVGAVLALALGLILAPRLGRLFSGPRSESKRAASSVPGERKAQAHTDERPGATRSAQKSSGEGQSSGATPQAPAASSSLGGAKTANGRVVKGEVLEEILPDVPKKARDTIRGTVKVSVRVVVDASGEIVQATLASPGPSRYFANLSMQAARRWEFAPAEVDSRYVSSEWLLRFEFGPTATKAFPQEVSP